MNIRHRHAWVLLAIGGLSVLAAKELPAQEPSNELGEVAPLDISPTDPTELPEPPRGIVPSEKALIDDTDILKLDTRKRHQEPHSKSLVGRTVEVPITNGERFRGKIVAVTPNWVILETEAGEVWIAAQQLLYIRVLGSAPLPEVELPHADPSPDSTKQQDARGRLRATSTELLRRIEELRDQLESYSREWLE